MINFLTRPFLLDTNNIKNRNIDFMEYLSDEKDVVIRLKLIPNYESSEISLIANGRVNQSLAKREKICIVGLLE